MLGHSKIEDDMEDDKFNMRRPLEKRVPYTLSRKNRSRGDRLANVDWGKLTPRQMDLVVLLEEGLTMKEIGAALGISEGTVRNHCSAIVRRLGLNGVKELRTAVERLIEGENNP